MEHVFLGGRHQLAGETFAYSSEPPEPSQDGGEEAAVGQREREGSGQLGVRRNRFEIEETDG